MEKAGRAVKVEQVSCLRAGTSHGGEPAAGAGARGGPVVGCRPARSVYVTEYLAAAVMDRRIKP